MKRRNTEASFALALTLVLMGLIVIVVVAYLANTRIERSTSSVYANQLRAKVAADTGLAAAMHLLRDNTRYGNYITAMPPTAPAPVPRRTELYRPGVSASDLSPSPNDYLRLSNAVGETLSSRAISGAPPLPPVDPRPPPDSIPATGPFEVSNPGFTIANSYDFNQIVRLGSNNAGRLVNSDGQPAFGQWVRVRNSAGDLIGRYAFFIEDESMKVNVNAAGNNVGGSNLRINDLTLPATAPAPATQIEETDPAATLPTTANRASADTTLTSLGNSGSRLPSRSTVALLNQWSANFSDYAHVITTNSKDDGTTAKGWKRLDLNKIVADAQVVGTAAAKKDAAIKIADWIRDAWTGSTPIANLQDYQMYGEDWLRKQIGANIVDYIDTDNTPTDIGDIIPPGGFPTAVPVIGIEKTPYLAAVEIIYQASDSNYPGSGSGTYAATMKLKVLFRFLNVFEPGTNLDLSDSMGSTDLSRIEVKGVPIVSKNGSTVYDVSSQTWSTKLSDLTPVNGTGTNVPAGVDGMSSSGARTFQTPWLDTRGVTFTVAPSSEQRPKFLAGSITVKIIGNRTGNSADDYRIDDTTITGSAVTTGYYKGTSGSAGDFLKDSNSTNGPLQIASINFIAGYQGLTYTGNSPWDPRYRGRLVSGRWNNDGRTDATYPCPWITPAPNQDRVTAFVDTAEVSPRTYGCDWFDYSGDRPLAFIRNGPMLNIGELGNIVACEYPWRTLYLQYPERPANATAGTGPPFTEVPLRRSQTMDYVLIDLFRTNTALVPRAAALNINTQQRYGSTQQHTLAPLFFGERVGTVPSLTQTMVDRFCTASQSASYSPIFDRRLAVGPPPDNTPLRPFFQIGELASVISRLVNTSPGGNGTTGSPGRSTVNYSLLRTSATTTNESPTNANIHQDMQVEQEFREVSNSITTRGNVFRVLYVGQSIKDNNHNNQVDVQSEIAAEYLSEAFVERQSVFAPDPPPSDIVRTSNSSYKVLTNRLVTE